MNHDQYDKDCLKTMMQIREQLRLMNHLALLKELYNHDLVSVEEYNEWLSVTAENQKLVTKTNEE